MALNRDFNWYYDNPPIEDEDSPDLYHRGPFSLPPLQTHSRYLYARRGYLCCGRDFYKLFCFQFHMESLCAPCELEMLHAASNLCWQCRTYFRRYGNSVVQDMVGVTYQRHDADSLYSPERYDDQARIPGPEQTCHQERQRRIRELRRMHTSVTCYFRHELDTWLQSRPPRQHFPKLPCIPMPYFSLMAQLPLRRDDLRFAAFDDPDPAFQNLCDEMLPGSEEQADNFRA